MFSTWADIVDRTRARKGNCGVIIYRKYTRLLSCSLDEIHFLVTALLSTLEVPQK